MADDMDSIFIRIGFGRWQLIYITAAILGPAALAPALIGSTLTNAPVAYRCKAANYSQHGLNKGNGTRVEFDNSCFVTSNSSSDGPRSSQTTSVADADNCEEWEYDTTAFTSTITMEWNLICEKSWMSPLYQVIIGSGCMLGDVVGGAVGDKLGRRATVRYGSIVVVIAILVIGLCPIYTLVLACRLLLGLSLSSIIYPCYNLVMEITPTSKRTIVGMILCAPYSVAVMIFAALGYYIRDWRALHLSSSIFAFLLLPVSWFLDESPRWLIQENRLQEAKKILEKAAAQNRSPFPPDQDLEFLLQKLYDNNKQDIDNESTSHRGLTQFFSKKAMTIITLVTPLTWFLMGVVYLGIPLNVSNFGSNPYIYLALTGVMEMLPTIVGVVFSKRCSRVPVMSSTFFVSGICSLILVAEVDELWRWILVMTAMFMISTNYMMSYVWAPELYPTVIRSRGCCSCALAGHLGFFVTPLITDVLAKQIWWLPSVVFASCGLLAASLVHLLPETKGLSLCETVQDVDDRLKAQRRKAAESSSNFCSNCGSRLKSVILGTSNS